MTTNLKTELRDLYHLSPVLWAVVYGCVTRDQIELKLGRDCTRAIRSAGQAGLLVAEGPLLHLVLHHHQELARLLNPPAEELPSHHVLKLLSGGPRSTQSLAELAGRTYNGTYKTLRRLEATHYVTRRGKLWAKV